MQSMNDKLLTIENLELQFYTRNGTVNALRDVNFHIEKGEIVGLVGESGCGKSATAQAIMQLLPKNDSRLSGKIISPEGNLVSKSEKEMQSIRGRKIAMIFQDPLSSLNPLMKIGFQLTEGMKLHLSLTNDEAKQKALKLLHDVGISDPHIRMQQYPFQLSGGMRQRIMIAMALACDPYLIIADEPTTALDVTIQAQILMLLKDIRKKLGTSILLITHDLGVVGDMCDRVMVMYGGKIVETADVHTLFTAPKHPYTQALLHSIPAVKKNKNEPLYSIKGSPLNLVNIPKGCSFANRCAKAMKICELQQPPLISSKVESTSCWLYHPYALRSKGIS